MYPEEEPSDAETWLWRNDLRWMTRQTVWPWRKSLERTGSSPVSPELLSWTLNSARTLERVFVSEVQ